MDSPYHGLKTKEWREQTKELLRVHPLNRDEIVEVTLKCWEAILSTKIGGMAQIGIHIYPRPQIE